MLVLYQVWIQILNWVYWSSAISHEHDRKLIKPESQHVSWRPEFISSDFTFILLLSVSHIEAIIFLATSHCHLSSRLKCDADESENITVYQELHDIWSAPPAVRTGQVGAVSVSGVTQCAARKQFGLVMTSAGGVVCLTVRGDVRKTRQIEYGKRGKKESKGMSAAVMGSLLIRLDSRLVSRGWLVSLYMLITL